MCICLQYFSDVLPGAPRFAQHHIPLDMINTAPNPNDNASRWSVTAPTYSSTVARISSVAVASLIPRIDRLHPLTSTSQVLDVGSGTGAVPIHIATNSSSTSVLATDISPTMLSSLGQNLPPNSAVRTRLADATKIATELSGQTFSHAFNTFMLQTITCPTEVLAQMHALLQPGGAVGIGIWGPDNGPFNIWVRAATSLIPEYESPAPFEDPAAWRTTGELEVQLRRAGFVDVETWEVPSGFPFPSAEAFAAFLFEAQNPAVMNVMANFTGDWAAVRQKVVEIVKADYDDGKAILAPVSLGVGRKPS